MDKYKERLKEKTARIQDLEELLALTEERYQSLSEQLRLSQEKERVTAKSLEEVQKMFDETDDDLDETSARLATLQVELIRERSMHKTTLERTSAEATRLKACADVLRVEYLTLSDTLKQTQDDLSRTRKDAVDLQKDLNSAQAVLDLERLTATHLREQKTEMESEHAAALQEAENRRARTSVELATSQDELDTVKEKLVAEEEAKKIALTTSEELQMELNQAQEEMQRLREQLEEKNRDLEEVQRELDETKEKAAMDQVEWEVSILQANDKIDELVSQVLEYDIALANARAEQAVTLATLKIVEDKAATDHLEYEASLRLADEKIRELDGLVLENDLILADAYAAHDSTKDALVVAQAQSTLDRAEYEVSIHVAENKIQDLTAELDALISERTTEQEEITTSLKSVNHLLSGGDPGGVSTPTKVVDQLVKSLTAQDTEFVGFLALVDEQIKKNDEALAGVQVQLVEEREKVVVVRNELEDSLKVAKGQIEELNARITQRDMALTEAQTENTLIRDALKVVEDKLAAEQVVSAHREEAVTFADAKISELSRELISHDECIAMLTDAEAAAIQEADELRVQNEVLAGRVSTLEAELVLSVTTASPIVEERGAMEDVIAKLEVAVSEKVKVEVALQEKEDTNFVLIQQLERECEAHQSTRDDVSSLQTRLASVSNEFAVAVKNVKSLEGRLEVVEAERGVLEEKVQAIVGELNKENEQLEKSKKSMEVLLMAKVSRCDELEKENRSLKEDAAHLILTPRGDPRSSSSNTRTGAPFSDLSNVASAMTTTPAKAEQKRTRGNSWFQSGVFSSRVSFLSSLSLSE